MVGVVPGTSGLLCRLEPCKNLRSRRRLSRSVPHFRARDDDGARFRSVDHPAKCLFSVYRLALLELPRSRPENVIFGKYQ